MSGFLARNKAQFVGLIAVFAIAGIVLFLVINIFFRTEVDVPGNRGLPEVEQQEITKTELQETLDKFGPWSAPDLNTKDPLYTDDLGRVLLLKEDGGIQVSGKRVGYQGRSISSMPPPEISSLSLNRENNTATLETNKGRRFKVSTYQFFILEQTPTMMYFITIEGPAYLVESFNVSDVVVLEDQQNTEGGE